MGRSKYRLSRREKEKPAQKKNGTFFSVPIFYEAKPVKKIILEAELLAIAPEEARMSAKAQ